VTGNLLNITPTGDIKHLSKKGIKGVEDHVGRGTPQVKKLIRRLRVSHGRKSTGLYMLEMLIALATSSALAAALVSNLAETQRFSSAGQDNVMAFAVAQEIVDMARNMPFGSLGSVGGPMHYNLAVNRLSASDPVGDAPFVHPLLIDVTNPNQTWSDAARSNLFEALASIDVTPKDFAADGTCLSKRVKVTVQWPSVAPTHSYVMYTLVSQNGIHN
jgi:hypothetical protein